MTDQSKILDKLGLLKDLAPAGYALAMHVRFTAPTFLFQTYGREWLDHYSQQGLVMSDPTVLWGFENRGFVDWSELVSFDTANVLEQAASFGLGHGVTCSIGSEAQPSIGSFSRNDRPFTADEAQTLCEHLEALHQSTDNLEVLSPETAESLRTMSIRYTHPN